MAGDMINLSARVYAQSMANRVKRERERIAVMIDERAEVERLSVGGEEYMYNILVELAETIRNPKGPGVTLAPVKAFTEDQDGGVVDDDAEEPELPPVRLMDDFEEGTALVRGRSSFGRSMAVDLPTD